jgi:hypothetical protein
METIVKDGVEITMPAMDKTAELNMERCAEFMARMIQKYGDDVLAEIRSEEQDNAVLKEKSE